MLSDTVLIRAGHYLFCSEYADLFEQHGGSFGAGARIEHCVDAAPPEKLLPIMREYEAELVKAWGKPVEEVAMLMDMGDDDGMVDLVYYTLMSCRGHGIGMLDDHRENIDLYERVTGEEFKRVPIHTELTELSDLAHEELQTPDPEFAVFEGDEVIEGKFWDAESAEQWVSDCGFGSDGYEVCEVEKD